MHRRNHIVDGRRLGRSDIDVSMAIPDGRESVCKHIGRNFFYLHPFERKRGLDGLPGCRQFGRQRVRFNDVKYSDCDHPRSDCDYDAAGRF